MYLPIGPYAAGGKGAFLVALEEEQFGSNRDLDRTRRIVMSVVEAYEQYRGSRYTENPILAGTEIVQPLWEQLWHACRDSRTLLPKPGELQASAR